MVDSPCLRFAASLLVVFFGANQAEAAKVVIKQTFGPALYPVTVNGVERAVEGNWVFTIVTDTSNPDLDPDPYIGRFVTESVLLTNSGLGLVNVPVINAEFYFEERSRPDVPDLCEYWFLGAPGSGLTFGSNVSVLLGQFDGETCSGGSRLGDPNVIETAFLDFGTVRAAWIQVSIVLANGMQIGGFNIMEGGSQLLIRPERALADLIEKVLSMNLQSGISSSFDAKLAAAINALDGNRDQNDVAAIGAMSAFIDAVNSQRGKRLTSVQADSLIWEAQLIILALQR